MKHEIKFAGFGGQGIILAGEIIGKAVTLYEGRNAVLTSSYGPEARGGACAASVIIHDTTIYYPYVRHPDILIIMSQPAYDEYIPNLKASGILLLDEDLVQPDNIVRNKHAKVYKIPATRFAEQLGRKIIANIVMLGFFTSVTRIIGYESMKTSILTSVPAKTRELNERAFIRGYDYGKTVII